MNVAEAKKEILDYSIYDGTIYNCSICMNLLRNPVCCKVCEDVFCGECLVGWMLRSRALARDVKCMTCKSLLTLGPVSPEVLKAIKFIELNTILEHRDPPEFDFLNVDDSQLF
jgi:hypothetical protein